MTVDQQALQDAAAGFLDNVLPAVGNWFDGRGYVIEYFDPATGEITDAEHGSLHAIEQLDPNIHLNPVELTVWIGGIAVKKKIKTTPEEVSLLASMIEKEKQTRERR